MDTTGETIYSSFQSPPRPTSEDSFASPPSTGGRRRKHNRLNQQGLPECTDRTLLSLLLSPHRLIKFSHVCQGDLDTYGTPGSLLQKRVQNRRSFLKHLKEDNNDEFIDLCRSAGLLSSQQGVS